MLGAEAVARETLVRLKELGVKLSIDDPGMAFSSLFWLATMPLRRMLSKYSRSLCTLVSLSVLRTDSGKPPSLRYLVK